MFIGSPLHAAQSNIPVINMGLSSVGPGPVAVEGYDPVTGSFSVAAVSQGNPACLILIRVIPSGKIDVAYRAAMFQSSLDTTGMSGDVPVYQAQDGTLSLSAPGAGSFSQAVGYAATFGPDAQVAGYIGYYTPAAVSYPTGYWSVFGDGSDGPGAVGSNLVLQRDMYYDSLVVYEHATLLTNGFRIFVKNTLTVSGTISFDGPDGFSGPVSNPGNTVGGGYPSNSGGGYSTQNVIGGNSGAGGNSYSFNGYGGGSTGSPPQAGNGGTSVFNCIYNAVTGMMQSGASGIWMQSPWGGVGGGNGSTMNGNGTPGYGGAGGGIIHIIARTVVGNGLISSRGGDGGNAVAGSYYPPPGTPLSLGGGGGGGGGVVVIVSSNDVTETALTLDVGGGSPGTGVYPASAAGEGQAGQIFLLRS